MPWVNLPKESDSPVRRCNNFLWSFQQCTSCHRHPCCCHGDQESRWSCCSGNVWNTLAQTCDTMEWHHYLSRVFQIGDNDFVSSVATTWKRGLLTHHKSYGDGFGAFRSQSMMTQYHFLIFDMPEEIGNWSDIDTPACRQVKSSAGRIESLCRFWNYEHQSSLK